MLGHLYIGLNIDEKLNWEKHINDVSNIISKKIGILYRIKHFVTRNTLIMLYNAFILPHITYGLEVNLIITIYRSTVHCSMI